MSSGLRSIIQYSIPSAVALALVVSTACAPADTSTQKTESAEASTEGPIRSLIANVVSRTEEVTLPSGTRLDIELNNTLSSHVNRPGDRFTARLAEDVLWQDEIAVPAGVTVTGTVRESKPAEKIGSRARLTLDFTQIELPGGATHAISATFADIGKSERAKDAAIIGGSTIGGAVLGHQVDDDKGSVIGAIVGGIAGTVAAKETEGKPVELPAGTRLTLELQSPLTVEITN